MSCYHPIYSTTSIRADGKRDVKVWSAASVSLWEKRTGKQFIKRSDFLPLPCGHCIGCRLEYSRQWAARCMCELEYCDSAYFVTLTYNPQHLPLNADPKTGELIGNGTLRKRDLQLFMKRLRRRFPDLKIRFFAAGEYGEKGMRPHYHLILFGLKLDDLKFYSVNENGDRLYTSDTLQRVWSDKNGEIGFVVVGNVTYETCAYTARYIVKKLYGKEKQTYYENGMEPEFSLMSLKPGIGRKYFEEHPEMFDYDFINMATQSKGLRFKRPLYFDRIFDEEFPEKAVERKQTRERLAQINMENRLQLSELSYDKQLAVDEENFKEQNRKRLARK